MATGCADAPLVRTILSVAYDVYVYQNKTRRYTGVQQGRFGGLDQNGQWRSPSRDFVCFSIAQLSFLRSKPHSRFGFQSIQSLEYFENLRLQVCSTTCCLPN